MTSTTEPATRRDRARAATVVEIKSSARRLLVAHGVPGLSLRAVARDLGVSAPALYRYFPSHEELVAALTVDLYDELTAAMTEAIAGLPEDQPPARLLALGLAFREWAVAHPAEFELTFASPLPDLLTTPVDELSPCEQAGGRFCAVFTEELVKLWHRRPFPVPSRGELDPRLVEQLEARADQMGNLPVEASYVILAAWTRLYGLVCMEVTGHLRWALDDVEPFYFAQVVEIGATLGLTLDDLE